MKNNKGLTLIELIISLVIFAIVMTAAFSFMLAGTHSYEAVTDRLSLNLEAQLALNQLGDYVLDCNAGLSYSDGTLYVVDYDDDGSGGHTAPVFQYRDGSLYYGKGSASLDSLGRYTFTVTAVDLLAEHVTAFSVTPVSADGEHISSAVLSLEFAKRAAAYSGEKIVALRNKPEISSILAG